MLTVMMCQLIQNYLHKNSTIFLQYLFVLIFPVNTVAFSHPTTQEYFQ